MNDDIITVLILSLVIIIVWITSLVALTLSINPGLL